MNEKFITFSFLISTLLKPINFMHKHYVGKTCAMGIARTVLITILFSKLFANKFAMNLVVEEQMTLAMKQHVFKSSIFQTYAGFSIVFHMENSTLYNVNSIITLLHEGNYSEMIILNHDIVKYINIRWKKITPYLNLVFLYNLGKYESFLTSAKYLTRTDIVFFVMLNEDMTREEFWKWPMLKRAGNVVVYDNTKSKLSLYNVCYYCGNLSGKLNHLHTTDNILNIVVPPYELQPRNFTNFNNHHFHVGYVNSFPNMLCEKATLVKDETVCLKAIGMEMEILRILSEKLNFTFVMTEYKKFLNQLEEDLSFDNSSLDFVIGGVSITSSRAAKMSFTSYVDIEPYSFLYIPRKARGSEFFGSIKPFKFELWIIVLVSTVWFSLVLHSSTKVHEGNRQFSLSKCFGICFKAAIEQVERIKLNSINTQFSSHAILIVWWFACVIIVTAYKSKLWAISIMNHNVEPSDLEQLLNSGYHIVVSKDNVEVGEDILNNGDPLTIAAQKKLRYKDDMCSAVEYIFDNKAALVNENGVLQYHSLIICSHLLRPNYLNLRLTAKSIHHTTHSWPLKRGAVYKNAFDKVIDKILKSGMKKKWRSDSLRRISHNYTRIPLSKTTTSYPDLNDKYFLKGFVSAFSVYVLGNVMALVCFCVEMLRAKSKT